MGSACCVAARDSTIINGSGRDVMPRNVRSSPSWSFRWDNRGRVAGEDMSMNWLSDGVGTNVRLDNKSQITQEAAYQSEDGSPLEISRNLAWQKSSSPERNTVCQSDPSNSKAHPQVKESSIIPVTSEPSPTKMSPSTLSVSSLATSPLSSSQGLPPSNLTPSRWPRRSPGRHLLRQVSDSRIPGMKSPNLSISEEGSPFMLPGWRHNSNRGSHGGSSDGFSELMAASNREGWSFDSESLSFSRDKIGRSSGRVSSSSIDMRTCSICTKFLAENSPWGGNELAVVAILMCGHVYHAECLENITPEIYKYDPVCPVCTLGEKQVLKLSEKALKAETDLKAKMSKKLRHRVMDGDSPLFDGRKSSSRGPKMSSSSSMKSSLGKPFLKKHFTFGSNGSRSLSENNSSWKKGFFRTKSSKA